MKRYIACFTLVCFLIVSLMIPQASANFAGQQIASAISSFIGSYGFQWTSNNLRDSGATEALARDIDNYLKSGGISDSAQDWLNFGTDVFYRQPGKFVFNHTAARKAAEFVGWFTAKYGLDEPGITSVVQEAQSAATVPGFGTLVGSDLGDCLVESFNDSQKVWVGDGYAQITSITAPFNPSISGKWQTVRFALTFFSADGTLLWTTAVSQQCYYEPNLETGWYMEFDTVIADYGVVGSALFRYNLILENANTNRKDLECGFENIPRDILPSLGIDLVNTGTLSVTAPAVSTPPPVSTMTSEQSLVVDTGIDSQSIDELVTAINALIASNAQTKTEYIIIDKVFSEDEIIDGLTWQERLAEIGDDIRSLPGDFADAIAGVFVPDAALTQEISTTFTNKFGFLPTIHQVGTDLLNMDADTSPPVIYIHLEDAEGRFVYGGTEKALDMAWYQRYKASGDAIISGFLWLGFLWMVFKRASAIIQGGEMVSEIAPDIGRGYRKRGE